MVGRPSAALKYCEPAAAVAFTKQEWLADLLETDFVVPHFDLTNVVQTKFGYIISDKHIGLHIHCGRVNAC